MAKIKDIVIETMEAQASAVFAIRAFEFALYKANGIASTPEQKDKIGSLLALLDEVRNETVKFNVLESE
jgi:hypothetical protein